MPTFDYKKLFFAAGLAAGLFLIAGQAMAMAYAQGTKSASTTMMGQFVTQEQQDQAAANQQNQGLRQSQGYPVTGSFGSVGNISTNYRPVTFAAQSSVAPLGYGNSLGSWMSLMAVITTVLVWIVLIQLIFLLAKYLKKHNRE